MFPVSVVTVCSVPLTAVCSFLWSLLSSEILLLFFSNILKGYSLNELFFFGNFSVIPFTYVFVQAMTMRLDSSPLQFRET